MPENAHDDTDERAPSPHPDVEVPRDVGMNWGLRDVRPYLRDDRKEQVDAELYPHDRYAKGVIPHHVQRAAGNALAGGAFKFYGSGSIPETLRYMRDTGTWVLGAPFSGRDMYRQADEISRTMETARTMEDLRSIIQGTGRLSMQMSHALAPYSKTYREWKQPAEETATQAAQSAAKARRKASRRDGEESWLQSMFVRPFKDHRSIRRQVREQRGEDEPVQVRIDPVSKEAGFNTSSTTDLTPLSGRLWAPVGG